MATKRPVGVIAVFSERRRDEQPFFADRIVAVALHRLLLTSPGSGAIDTGSQNLMPSDEQDQSEQLDDEQLPEEYPPEEAMGVDAYGTTAAEERAGEPVTEAIARENSDFSDRARQDPGASV